MTSVVGDVLHGPASGPTALFTDQYELTMVQAAHEAGTARRRSVFEVFSRRLPAGRRYGVVAGTGRLLQALTEFTFGAAELAALDGVVDAATRRWLAGYRFSGSIWGYAEGECFFPGSPILVVEGSFAEAVLLETLALSILNHDSAIAAGASRMVTAAAGRPCLEMGSRRTHEHAAVAAARAAYVAGFAGTSNLEAGRRYGIDTIGTAAHSFTLLHDSERDAFAAQVASLGPGTTLLVDTYDIPTGVRTAVQVAGTSLAAVRLDSGDLLETAREVRALLDSLGATKTRIVVTSDLDEFAIAALGAGPVDSYGVGTSLVTGSGHPTAGLIYKLVAREDGSGEMTAVAKTSLHKAGVGGRKLAHRRLDDDGTATAEVVHAAELVHAAEVVRTDGGERNRQLLVPLVREGEVLHQHTGHEGLAQARSRHAASLSELPRTALQLQRGEPAIPTTTGED